MIVQYFLILLFLPLLSTTTTAGLFDLAEYRRVSYDATIGENFLWFAPELDIREVTPDNIDAFEKQITDKIPDESFPNYVFVTSKGGQRFACSIPEVEELKQPTPPRSSKNPKQYDETLSASFYIEKCIKLRERSSWWSYILCRGRTVEQIHGEQGEEGFVKNILGIFDGTFTMPSYQESTEDRLLYVEESYTSGTYCELNKEPRRTTVRYECDSQLSTNEAYISSLVEVVPCQYLMIVKVGSLCSYPEFLPVTLANTKKIGCHPHLTKKEVREILERQLEEKRQEERLLNKMATAKQAFRRAIERFNAMTKSSRTMNIPDYVKKTNAEMNYRASYFNLLIASLELEGEEITRKKENDIWKLFSTTDIGDYMFYSDYDTITDENRGHLWHYFNDPTWPKNEFPKDIIAIAIQNGYVAEVQDNLLGKYVFEDAGGKLTEGLNEFLKTGRIDLETNLVITAREIYEEIIMIIHDESMMKHNWLNWISLFFTEDLDRMENEFPETMESIMESIIEPSTEFFWPLGNLANEALLTIHDDVWQDMIELSRFGPKSELLDPKSWNYKAIYKPLQIVPFPENKPLKVGDRVFHYNVTISEEKTKLYFTLEYLRLLAPIYKLLSIEWFLDKNRQYFHTRPPTDDFLVDGESDDYKFHYNLARDMAMFSRMLSFSTHLRIKDFEKWRDGEKARPRSVESVRKIFKNNPVDVNIKLIDLAETILQNEVGPSVVALARERIWKRRVEKYRTNYWTKDYKLRKQAKSMQGMMMDMLSIKDDTVSFVTLGGNTESKKKDKFDRKFDDYLMEKLSKFTNIEDIDFDAIKKTFESIIDEGSLEFDDIEQVFDLLEKAGLSKNSEIKFKIFEEDRIEMVKDQMMTEYTNNLFMEEEDRNKMKNSEKAYMKKVIKEIQKKLEEEGE